MDGESDLDLSSEQNNGSGGLGELQRPEESFEIESVDGKFEDVQQNEDEFATDLSNGSKEEVPIDFVGPRMSISAKYFANADFVTEKCTAYNKIFQPAKQFDTFCAVTLTTSDSSPIMMEIGDCFSYLIFIGCIKLKENNTASSLLLLFIKSSWLERCPPESEGIDVMRKVDRKNFLNCYYLFHDLTYFIFSQHIIVPELEMYDERILSVEEMLNNKCIQNVRTGDLNNTNRKFILLRLLMQLLGNREFQEQLVTCSAASVSENVEGDKSAPIISLVDDDGKEPQDASADDGAPAVVDNNSADHTLPPPKKKNAKGTKGDKTAKALKELGCFGDFSFDSSTPRGYNTRNGGEISGEIGGKPNSASTTTAEGKGTSKGGVKKAPPKAQKPLAVAKEKSQHSKRPVVPLKNQKGKKEDYEVQDFDDYVGHYDYGAKIPANHFDPAQFQQTIENAAKAAAQVATADLRRAHEVELKRMQEELRRKEEALNNAKQQPPHHSSNFLNNLF